MITLNSGNFAATAKIIIHHEYTTLGGENKIYHDEEIYQCYKHMDNEEMNFIYYAIGKTTDEAIKNLTLNIKNCFFG